MKIAILMIMQEKIPVNLSEGAGVETRETFKNVDALYVLHHGDPKSEEPTMDAKVRTLAALEAAKENREMEIYFVGGMIEGKPSGSMVMRDYFLKNLRDYNRKLKKEGKEEDILDIEDKIKVLSYSNNTVGNINEIIDSLPSDKQRKIMVLSSDYHLKRVGEIMQQHDLGGQVYPAEELLRGRSKHHDSFVDRYEKSSPYEVKKIIDGLMLLYLKIDPEYQLVERWRDFSRNKL